MWKYCGYCLTSLLKKKTVWVSTLIYWLFFSLILFIIPLSVQLSPFAIWSIDVVDLQSYTIIILALICASAAVVIFKDPKDDGTELIVFSKSITRTKIIAGKFISFLICGVIIIGVTCILFTFTTLDSKYHTGDLPKYLSSYIIGGAITFILFMGISVIISCVSGKIGIMVSTIGLSILLNITHLTLPMFATTPSDYITKKYNVDFNSNRCIVAKDGKNSLKNYVSMSTPGTTNKTAWDYAKDANAHNTSKLVSYIDFGGQIGDTYFTANGNKDLAFSNFGDSTNINYKVTSNKSIYQDEIVGKNDSKFYSWPSKQRADGKNVVFYQSLGSINTVPGMNDLGQSTAQIFLTALGANSNSVANVITRNNYIGGNHFADFKTIDTFNDRDYVNYIFDKYIWYGQRWANKTSTPLSGWHPSITIGGTPYIGSDMGYTIGRAGANGSKPEQLVAKVNGNTDQMLFPGQSLYFGNAASPTGLINPIREQQYYFSHNIITRSSFATDCSMLLNKDPGSADYEKTGSPYVYPQNPPYDYDGSLYDTPDGNLVPDFNALNGQAGPGTGKNDIIKQYPEWAALTDSVNTATYPTHASSDANIQSTGTLPKESVQDHLIKALGPYDPSWDNEIILDVAYMKLAFMYAERMSSIYWNPDRWYVDVNNDFKIPSYSLDTSIDDNTNVSRAFASSQGEWSNTYYDKNVKIGNDVYTPFDDSQIIKLQSSVYDNRYDDIPSTVASMCYQVICQSPVIIPGQQTLVSGSRSGNDPDRQKSYDLYDQSTLYMGTTVQANGIEGVQDMYPYEYSLYLTNSQEAAIWACASFVIFAVIVVVYSKADFK